MRNLEFCSDAGGATPGVTNLNFSVADFGTTILPTVAPTTNTTYRATDYSTSEANNYFGPTFTINHPVGNNNGIATFASAFAGATANGTWTLYVRDGQAADVGSFASWSVAIATDGGPPINQAPVISSFNGDNPTFTEGAVALLLDVGANAAVTDSDSADFNTGTLTASITVNKFSAEDVLGISTAHGLALSRSHGWQRCIGQRHGDRHPHRQRCGRQ